MKKIFLIISFIFLCGISDATENKISKEVFNNLVDYVNCKYANQYINNYTPKNENEKKAYTDSINSLLDNCRINHSLSEERLINLLKNNKWGKTADKLVKNRNESLKYKDVLDKTDLKIIEYITNVSNENTKTVIGDDFINNLKTELETFVNKIGKTEHIVVNNDFKMNIEDAKKKANDLQINDITELKQSVSKLEKGKNFNGFIEIIQLGIILFFIFLLFKRKKFSENRFDSVNEQDQYLRKSAVIEIINKTVLENKITDIELDNKINKVVTSEEYIKRIVNKVVDVRVEVKRKEEATAKTEPVKPDSPPKPVMKYLKEREGDLLFKEALEENAYYEIFDINGNKGSYQFCGNVDRAMANYDAVLKDVFDDGRTYSSKAKKIENVENGIVELQLDGKWKIKIPAKIKFI